MNKPPIKAMKSVKRFCIKQRKIYCEGCPIRSNMKEGFSGCSNIPADWEIQEVNNED